MADLISVVVPVYNVEDFLELCINSVLFQSYDNLELILVDDGSTDRSGNICELYRNNKKVKIIHQKNGGLTVARRSGVNVAKGKYVTFVDGDDWIDGGMYESLMKTAVETDADIITSEGFRDYEWGIGKEKLGDTLEAGEYDILPENHEVLKFLFSSAFSLDAHINGAVWNKLFKTEIIRTVLNEMDDQVHGYMDDNVCLIGCALLSKKLCITHQCFYHHRERTTAFTYSQNSRGFLQINYAYLNIQRFLKKSDYFEELYPYLWEHTSQRLIQAYDNFFEKQYVKMPSFFYKDEEIAAGAKVVIYGCGNVGQAYKRQFQIERKYILLGCVDKQECDLATFRIEELVKVDFDYIIVAVYKECVMLEIKNELKTMNVPEKKIRWIRPKTIFEYYQL